LYNVTQQENNSKIDSIFSSFNKLKMHCVNKNKDTKDNTLIQLLSFKNCFDLPVVNK